MQLFSKKSPSGSATDQAEVMSLLSRYSGVGLWDAVLHEADPMHARSQWRWSDEFRRLLGFAHGDTVGFPNVVGSWADRLHPEDAGPTFDAFGACLNDQTGRTGYDVSYRLKMKDGSYRWFRAIGGVARNANGRAERACGALIDIDAQKNEAEVSALLGQNAGVGLWDALLHDGDPMHAKSRWTWSGEFRRLLGFDRNDERGFPNLPGSWADRLHPEDAGQTLNAFSACLADKSGRTGYDVTYRLKMKDGSYRWFRAVGGVSRDRGGVAQRACGSLIDVNGFKMAEVRQANAEAERRKAINNIANTLDSSITGTVDRAKASAQTVASASEQLAASIAEISTRMAKAAEASSDASEEAARTNATVQALVTAADRIGAVVNLINEIASQTNLLALNATIEAARAGEAGRGFAIVANEVKSLANQTAKATGDIAAQIASVQQEAGRAVSAIGSIGKIISQVQELSAGVTASVSQQDSATKEIAMRVTQVVNEIEEVSRNVNTVTRDLRA